MGSIHDAAGHPIAGALVVANGPTTREALTSAAGIVTLQALPLGSYLVAVTRVGYAPSETSVRLHDARSGPTLVALRIESDSFASDSGAGRARQTIDLEQTSETPLANALERSASIELLALAGGAGAAPSLLGTAPEESRAELDGIPLAGGSTGLAALRLRSAFAYSAIEIARGPAAQSPTPRGAIGGTIDYRTPDIDGPGQIRVLAGYRARAGSFERVRVIGTFGKLGIASAIGVSDIDAGDSQFRTQTLKFRYALLPATTLGFAQYGSQGTARIGTENASVNAPAFAADLRSALGGGKLEARAFGSSAEVFASQIASARVHGTQLRYALPVGEALYALDFDRRTEDERGASQTYTTLTARADIALTANVRIAVGDAYSGGTSLRQRHDPQIGFALRMAPRTTLDVAAGSAYATAPSELRSRAGDAARRLTPETALGYRIGVERALAAGDRAWIALDTLRRLDRFAVRANARSSDLELGYERAPLAGRLGTFAYVRVRRANAYGPVQPLARVDDTRADFGAGDPFTKARIALSYADANASFAFGGTYLGANNALTGRALVLGDAHLRFSVARLFDLGLGIDNLFGTIANDPALRPFYVPRELSLTVGRIR